MTRTLAIVLLIIVGIYCLPSVLAILATVFAVAVGIFHRLIGLGIDLDAHPGEDRQGVAAVGRDHPPRRSRRCVRLRHARQRLRRIQLSALCEALPQALAGADAAARVSLADGCWA